MCSNCRTTNLSMAEGDNGKAAEDHGKWNIFTEENCVNQFTSDREKLWQSPWYFIQGADPQYGLIERYINKNPKPNWDKEIELTEKIVKKINALNPKPKFFVICGDLCDAVSTDEPDLFKAQEDTFKRIFSQIDPNIPVLVTCGNHDVGDCPTPESLKRFKNSWGDDFYSFWCGGIFFITINSQYFMNPQKVPVLAKAHETWLNQQLESLKSEAENRAIVFQHIPWFLKSPDENENNYFCIRKEIRDVWLEKLSNSGVQKVFCGHLHRNAGGMFKSMEVIVSSAMGGQLGSDKSGIRVVKIYKDKIEHDYYAVDDIPISINI